MGRWVDRWVNGWVDRCVDGCMGRQMIDKEIYNKELAHMVMETHQTQDVQGELQAGSQNYPMG